MIPFSTDISFGCSQIGLPDTGEIGNWGYWIPAFAGMKKTVFRNRN